MHFKYFYTEVLWILWISAKMSIFLQNKSPYFCDTPIFRVVWSLGFQSGYDCVANRECLLLLLLIPSFILFSCSLNPIYFTKMSILTLLPLISIFTLWQCKTLNPCLRATLGKSQDFRTVSNCFCLCMYSAV